MAKGDVNPLEEMTEEGSEIYVDMVFEFLEELAPFKPWWQADISPDGQIWRWITGGRDEILVWLEAVAPFMGWETTEEILAGIPEIFTTVEAENLIPQIVVAQIPSSLLEMVQAIGPEEVGKHIRKMERMMAGRQQAEQAIQAAKETLPDIDIPDEATTVALGQLENTEA